MPARASTPTRQREKIFFLFINLLFGFLRFQPLAWWPHSGLKSKGEGRTPHLDPLPSGERRKNNARSAMAGTLVPHQAATVAMLSVSTIGTPPNSVGRGE